MEQVDTLQVRCQRQVQQGHRPVRRTAHHQLAHIRRPAQRLLAQGVAQKGEFAIGRQPGQVSDQRRDTLADAAGTRTEIAAIERDPCLRWSDYTVHSQEKSARFRFIGKIPHSAASDSPRSASLQPFALYLRNNAEKHVATRRNPKVLAGTIARLFRLDYRVWHENRGLPKGSDTNFVQVDRRLV